MSSEREGDLDARWADIIAHWDDPAPDGVDAIASRTGADEPSPEPGTELSPAPDTERGTEVRLTRDGRDDPSGRDDAPEGDDPIDGGWRAYEPAAEDEHWDPPPPAPLPPAHDVGFWVAAAGLVLGPGLLLFTVLVRPDYSSWWGTIGAVLTIVGFAVLVHRGTSPSDEDDFGIRL